jgi:hypothetical protein
MTEPPNDFFVKQIRDLEGRIHEQIEKVAQAVCEDGDIEGALRLLTRLEATLELLKRLLKGQ